MRFLALVLATLLLLAGSAPGFAHALLRRAVPGVGSTVKSAPAELTLIFSEGVEPAFCQVAVRDGAGSDLATGSLHTAQGDQRTLLAALKPLPAGTYQVEWHATSVDTHKTEGKFTFTVAP